MKVIEDIRRIIYSLFDRAKLDEAGFRVEISRDLNRCDVTTNAALLLGKLVRRNPRDIATVIVSSVLDSRHPLIKEATVEGPGFINFFLHVEAWTNVLTQVNAQGTSYGSCDYGAGKSVNLEFVSANPTGPLHVGHARGAIIFDVLGNLLKKCGYSVVKEYYINDSGSQVDKIMATAFYRYQEALGKNPTIAPEMLYPGMYVKGVGSDLVKKYSDKLLEMQDKERDLILRSVVLDAMMALVRKDLTLLKVKHDVFSKESVVASEEKIAKMVEVLKKKGLVYEGVLDPPRGGSVEDEEWTSEKNLLFRAKKYGDSSDRSLTKGAEGWTYFAKDVAYHYDKLSREFDLLIVGLGRDHFGYTRRLQACVSALSDGKKSLEIQLYNVVKFSEGASQLKMSKRAGTFLSISDVVKRLGSDVVRFMMLTRHHEADLHFDFKKAVEQSKDNPVFYVHYSFARANSVLKKFSELRLSDAPIDFSLLKSEMEINLIKYMARWPDVVLSAALSREVHRVVFYLVDLAELFHALWSAGKQDAKMRFVDEACVELTIARVFMVRAFVNVVASALDILSIDPVLEM